MMSYITFVGFILSVLMIGVSIGKFIERVNRLLRKLEDDEHKYTKKDRP